MNEMLSDRDVFDLSELRPLFGSEGRHPNLGRLLRKAESMGYATVISALGWEDLRRERRPVITRVVMDVSWNDYVLLQGIVEDEAILVDGELRVRRLSREEFGRLWTGWVVILQRRIQSAGA